MTSNLEAPWAGDAAQGIGWEGFDVARPPCPPHLALAGLHLTSQGRAGSTAGGLQRPGVPTLSTDANLKPPHQRHTYAKGFRDGHDRLCITTRTSTTRQSFEGNSDRMENRCTCRMPRIQQRVWLNKFPSNSSEPRSSMAHPLHINHANTHAFSRPICTSSCASLIKKLPPESSVIAPNITTVKEEKCKQLTYTTKTPAPRSPNATTNAHPPCPRTAGNQTTRAPSRPK